MFEKITCIAILTIAAALPPAIAQTKVSPETRKQAEKCLQNGADFLIKMQNDDGSWGKYKMPSITALCVTALHDAPASDPKKRDAAIDKGVKNILSYVQDNGAIAKPFKVLGIFKTSDYANYNTAISLLALATLNRPEHINVMKAARAYLKKQQVRDPHANGHGGFGYAAGKKADLSNTGWAAEALHFTEHLDKEPLEKEPEKKKAENKEMREALLKFLDQCQNLPEEGREADDDDDGGLGYRPGMVSSGSMTYAGLKSMIYAKVDRKDVRVKGAVRFIRNNYTLAKNPGQGTKGLYYYTQTMAKALAAYGRDEIQLADGKTVNWREDMIKTLADRQTSVGAWVNADGRYLESMTELCTPYAMISIRQALGQ